MKEKLEVGIIGGSGFCTFPEIENGEEVRIRTDYGDPSDSITIGMYNGEKIAFLPRHGYQHQLPPHAIPYMANIMAFKEMGIEYVVAFCVAGSLKKRVKPGDFVIPDQFINLTWGRDDTFQTSQKFIHLPMAEPYSSFLRSILFREGNSLGLNTFQKGTVVVIQGPRFNTLAESRLLAKWGGDIVNMTQYPECYFAKEQGLQYAVVAAITDYDVLLQNLGLSMTTEKITESSSIFQKNIHNQKRLLARLLINWSGYKGKLKQPDYSGVISYEQLTEGKGSILP